MITKLNFTDRTIKSYAIRKLTPKECFRLMGVRDNVISTMQSSNAQAAERVPDWKGKGNPEDMAISSSQQFKQAGNSIVVDVLAHIYEQLFYPKPNQCKFKQLSLFTDTSDYLPDIPKNLANSGKEKIFLTTFSGYDSQLMAADLLKSWRPDFHWTCVGWSDIDKYACQMHDLVFPQFADTLETPRGRKYTLNFALADDSIIDGKVLASMFDPRKFMCKITPLHRTNSCEANHIQTSGGYDSFVPYKKVEEDLKANGFDVIVFIPSYDEDNGLITCGNAILSGKKPTSSYKEVVF